jgi:hypothetical protein
MGIVLPFPTRTAPAVEEAVWFSGGSLHVRYGAHVRHMEPSEAIKRRQFWADECLRLGCDPASPEARLAARRWSDFTRALDKLEEHNRIVGKPSPYAEACA